MHLDQLLSRLVGYLPKLAMLILIAVLGYVAARLLDKAVRWAVRHLGIEAAAERMGVSRVLYAVGVRAGLARVAGGVAFWTCLLFFIVLGAEVAGLSTVADGITQVIAYIPRVIIGVVLLVLGLRLADLVRNIVIRSAGDRLAAPQAVGTIVYYLVLVLTAAVAANQLGLQTTLLDGLIQVLVAAAAFGLALAVALAGRPALSHLIARQYVSHVYRPGDTVRIKGEPGIEGVVVRFSGTAAVIETAEGLAMVPCRQLLDATVFVKPLVAPLAPVETGPVPPE